MSCGFNTLQSPFLTPFLNCLYPSSSLSVLDGMKPILFPDLSLNASETKWYFMNQRANSVALSATELYWFQGASLKKPICGDLGHILIIRPTKA